MTFQIFNNYDSGVTFVTCIVAIPICVGVTALRLVQSSVLNGKPGAQDWFAVLALLAFLIYVGGTLWNMTTMNGKDVFELNQLPASTVIAIYKCGYVINIQTPLNQTFAKLSLLALYHRLFHVNPRFSRLIWGVSGIQVAWCVAMVFVRLFECSPVAGGWNPTIERTCLNNQIILAVGDSINSFLDFVIIAMAAWIVKQLRMSNGKKLKLALMFAVGGFSGIVGIIRIIEAYGKIGVNTVDSTWIVIQQATSILCCCAPIYRVLLQNSIFTTGFWQKLTSALTSEKRNERSQDTMEHRGREGPPTAKPIVIWRAVGVGQI